MKLRLIHEDHQNHVLAHIAGPAGVGKTTLMNKLKRAYPNVAVVDLDAFDNYANRKQSLPWDWRNNADWDSGAGDGQLRKSHTHRQAALDKFVANANRMRRPVILFGIHLEGDTEYKFDAPNRIYLIRPIPDIVRDRLGRDRGTSHSTNPDDEAEIERMTRETQDTMDELEDKGYAAIPIDRALGFIASIIPQ